MACATRNSPMKRFPGAIGIFVRLPKSPVVFVSRRAHLPFTPPSTNVVGYSSGAFPIPERANPLLPQSHM